MKISKLEAARRQLNCAIRLYFNDDDITSVITLSRASFRLLWDLYPTISEDGFEKPLGKIIEQLGWSKINEIANFLKHADKDPDAQMEPDEIHARTGIGFSVILYGRAAEAYTPEMQAWDSWMGVAEPEVWDQKPEPDHEGYADFQKCVQMFKVATREERLALARQMLTAFKKVSPSGYVHVPRD